MTACRAAGNAAGTRIALHAALLCSSATAATLTEPGSSPAVRGAIIQAVAGDVILVAPDDAGTSSAAALPATDVIGAARDNMVVNATLTTFLPAP